jgi:hypothetical protein
MQLAMLSLLRMLLQHVGVLHHRLLSNNFALRIDDLKKRYVKNSDFE